MNMYDKIEKIGNSIVQHGKQNDRIYLMKLDNSDAPQILCHLQDLAKNNHYKKFFAKVRKSQSNIFIEKDFKIEAEIPNFYNGKEDAVFLSKFLDKSREKIEYDIKQKININIETALKKSSKSIQKKLPDDFIMKQLDAYDSNQLSKLYKVVFASYPFPIHDPEYIKKTMQENIIYFGVFKDDVLVAASSCETDPKAQNVEMTDFATHPDYRGMGLGVILLVKMEEYMRKNNYLCTYTIARAMSPAMNVTFAKLGYKYSGTLINNTNISGNIESMNVWYKSLI
jgi:putative beta-lysine N-acetyltransferase